MAFASEVREDVMMLLWGKVRPPDDLGTERVWSGILLGNHTSSVAWKVGGKGGEV